MGWGPSETGAGERAEALVSNPLGWDGDQMEIADQITGKPVSNPLGWDGDSRGDECSIIIEEFLIH